MGFKGETKASEVIYKRLALSLTLKVSGIKSSWSPEMHCFLCIVQCKQYQVKCTGIYTHATCSPCLAMGLWVDYMMAHQKMCKISCNIVLSQIHGMFVLYCLCWTACSQDCHEIRWCKWKCKLTVEGDLTQMGDDLRICQECITSLQCCQLLWWLIENKTHPENPK